MLVWLSLCSLRAPTALLAAIEPVVRRQQRALCCFWLSANNPGASSTSGLLLTPLVVLHSFALAVRPAHGGTPTDRSERPTPRAARACFCSSPSYSASLALLWASFAAQSLLDEF